MEQIQSLRTGIQKYKNFELKINNAQKNELLNLKNKFCENFESTNLVYKNLRKKISDDSKNENSTIRTKNKKFASDVDPILDEWKNISKNFEQIIDHIDINLDFTSTSDGSTIDDSEMESVSLIDSENSENNPEPEQTWFEKNKKYIIGSTIVGGFVGGPVGAAIGAKIGAGIGSTIFGGSVLSKWYYDQKST